MKKICYKKVNFQILAIILKKEKSNVLQYLKAEQTY